MKGQSFPRKLGFAWAGLCAATVRESNFRLHILATVLVLAWLGYTHAPLIWWALCILSIGLVLVAELINSALEGLADRLHPEQHPEIRIVKDIAAAAVLVSAITALLIATLFILRGVA